MKKILYILLMVLTVSVFGCWDEPLLTELSTNRLEVRLKGTYASNDPRPWFDVTTMNPEVYNSKVLDDNSVDDIPYTNLQDYPYQFKFDLAEIRLEDAAGHEDRFSMSRQTFKFNIKTDDSSPNGVLVETDSFFNGTGVVLKNDDPVPGRTYTKVKLYIRKMIFDEAKYYGLRTNAEEGWKTDYADGENDLTVIFDEDDSEMGFDFNPYQTSYLWDAYREEQSVNNRIFPLEIPIEGGLTFDNKKDNTVLEIRLVIKNFIKKYELDVLNYTPSFGNDLTSPLIVHYFALSDWLRDVRYGESANGGNLHGVARSYVPGETGSITGTAPGTGYVIAVPSDAVLSEYYIDLAGADSLRDRYVTGTATKCDQPLIPSVPLQSIDALMDFYMKYEKYRIAWKYFDDNCGGTDSSMTNFTAAWDAYDGTNETEDPSDDGAARKFKIPPFAAYTLGTPETFEIQLVPPGDYKVFYFEFDGTQVATYGVLFNESTVTAGGGTVTVTAGSSANAGTL